MKTILTIAVIFSVALLTPQEALADCQDVDKNACDVFKKANATMCTNPCLANVCPGTCGLCPLKCYHCDSVPTAEACNTTVRCKTVSEVCIATQRFTTHLSTVFSSGCVGKPVCKTLFNTTMKRAYRLDGGCCSTDLCNHHDLDNKTRFDDVNSYNEETADVTAVNTDTCANQDVNSLACTLMKKADQNICNNDCVAHDICPVTCGTCVHCKTCKNIDDPAKCTNVTLCKSTESCFTREQLRDDFTLGFDLSCMDDFICHAYFGGIFGGVGKRQLNPNLRLNGQCCKKELCNANGIQTLTTASTG